MNKEKGSSAKNFRRAVLAGIGSGAALTLVAACSGSGSYGYEVSGVVEAAQVDYDCPRNLSMEPVGFVTGKHRRTTSSTGGSKSSSSSNSSSQSGSVDLGKAVTQKTSTPKAPAPRASTPKSRGGAVRQGGGSIASKAPTTTKSPTRKGVVLSKKPDAPERISKVPALKYRYKPRGCKVDDYELFVRNNDGLFEQDVRHADYINCTDRKRMPFPACTAN